MRFLDRTIICRSVAGMLAFATTLHAERLEPALMARDLVGTVTVQRPQRSEFNPVESGVAYPYGSRFRTQAESAVTLAMSDMSSVRVLAASDIVVLESTHAPQIKTVRVLDGEIEANLSAGFHSGGNILNVEAGNAVVQAKGTRFRVASRYDQDLRIVVVRVFAGLVQLLGENFQIAELGQDDWVSLLSPDDESFLRIKNMRGLFDVTIKEEDHTDRNINTEEGTVLKIWQRIVPESGERIVTSVLTDPEGEMIETITVVFQAGEFADFLSGVREDRDPWDLVDPDTRRRRREDREPPTGDNPMPPDSFLDELVQRSIENENPGAGRRPAPPSPPRPQPPRPPVRPTPTPVGNL